MRSRTQVLMVFLALVAAACNQPPRQSPKPLAVASFYPLYEFTRQVAGDRAEVISLVPTGVEPHDWEPAPQDVARIQKAKLVVYNGAGLEPWMDRLLKEAVAPEAVVVETTEGMILLSTDLPGHEHEQERTGKDPHVWLDPVLAQFQVERIRDGLVKADPANEATYSENARAFTARLAALHDAFQRGLDQCARRDIVVSHAAFGYLARRYRLTMVPVMGLAPESEPSPAQLASIVRFARRHSVRYIFFETLVSPKLAETLAREVGARTLVLNPVEGLTRGEAEAGKGYIALMEDNLKNLRTALECR